MAENLKQKLNRVYEKTKYLMFLALIFLNGGKIFAEGQEDNLTEEFFNAAMELDANNQASEAASNAAEQSMAAEQVGENAMNSGNNVLHTVKEFLTNVVDKIRTTGNDLSSKIGEFSGANPMITKIIVGLVLAIVSAIIITVCVIIAKKFIFKKKNLQTFDEEEEYEDDNVYEETDDENEQLKQEFDDFDEDYDSEPEIEDDTTQTTESLSDNDTQINITPALNAEEIEKHIAVVLQTPHTKNGAMKNFIKITQGL